MEEIWRLAGKMDTLGTRARMIQAVRRYFHERGYLEVETPLRIPAPAPEEHIDAVPSGQWYLQTSPELCMKRLLAAGYPRIFQISKCFRDRERGAYHLPEFTMLEWYRKGIDYLALMEECEEMISEVSQRLGLGDTIACRGKRISLRPPWERLTLAAAFSKYSPAVTLSSALESGRFDQVLSEDIEPHLGADRPTFLYEYPLSLGALARAKPQYPKVAERFELYIGGLELANAFSELADEQEQRRRFEQARRERLSAGKTVYPEAEPFLRALPGLGEAAGIALGIDRLAMIMTGAARIDEVVAFSPEDL